RLRLPSKSQLYSVLVAGRGVRPLGEDGDLLVPLRKLSLGASAFDVDVLYAYAGPTVGEEDFDVRLPEVKGLDVRRTTLSLWVPDGFDYSFETDMEEVDAADIAAGEVTQRYEEIKEAYAVTQRGNRIQKVRAYENAQQLEQDAKRLMDHLRANTRDKGKLEQIKSQEAAIKALQSANKAPVAAAAKQPQQGQQRRGPRKLKEWAANDAYLKKNRGDDTKQVEAYVDRNFAQRDSGRDQNNTYGVDLAKFKDSIGDGIPDITAASLFTLAERPEGVAAKPFFWRAAAEPSAGGMAVVDGLPVTSGLDDAASAGLDNFGPGVQDLRLRGATGRISLRIDLERKGKRYHFAYLGKDGGVSVDADEEGGYLLEALIALASAAAAAFVLVWKKR
ncbi:MAG: hypothetical protein OER88_09660, partial [Planctomycetota bacterium]|nr:hypothetical protein [Planctomycetota bacterium]